jgi:hypothetical protein
VLIRFDYYVQPSSAIPPVAVAQQMLAKVGIPTAPSVRPMSAPPSTLLPWAVELAIQPLLCALGLFLPELAPGLLETPEVS